MMDNIAQTKQGETAASGAASITVEKQKKQLHDITESKTVPNKAIYFS
jgi:hypothetical protein